MILRLILGGTLAFIYLLIFTNKVNWFSGFNEAQKVIFNPDSFAVSKAQTGFIIIYLTALFSLYFITFSQETIRIIIGVFLCLYTFMAFLAFS